MNLWFQASQIPEQAKINQASLLLEGNAFTWWMALSRENRTPRHWVQFEQEVTKQFQSFNASLQARNQLYTLRQIGSVADYISRFSNLVYQIEDLSESEAFYQFKKGLKPAIIAKMDEILTSRIHTRSNSCKKLLNIMIRSPTTIKTQGTTTSRVNPRPKREETSTKSRINPRKKGPVTTVEKRDISLRTVGNPRRQKARKRKRQTRRRSTSSQSTSRRPKKQLKSLNSRRKGQQEPTSPQVNQETFQDLESRGSPLA